MYNKNWQKVKSIYRKKFNLCGSNTGADCLQSILHNEYDPGRQPFSRKIRNGCRPVYGSEFEKEPNHLKAVTGQSQHNQKDQKRRSANL